MADILLNGEQKLQLSIIMKSLERHPDIPEDVWQGFIDRERSSLTISQLAKLIDLCDENLIEHLRLCYDRVF